MMRLKFVPLMASVGLLAACNSGGHTADDVPGDANDHQPFAEIAPGDRLQFIGTEPFWGGEATGTALKYTTPENQAGEQITVQRFAGRGGISLSGTLEGQAFDMAIAVGKCSDGMSDRTYPYSVTLRVRGEQRNGCAWTDKHPFEGPTNP